VQDVAFSPDGRILATCTSNRRDDKTFYLWELETGRLIRRLDPVDTSPGWSTAVAFSPDGKLIVGCWGLGFVTAWDAVGGQPRFSKKLHNETVYCLKFLPDGTHFVTGGTDGRICVTRVSDQEVVAAWSLKPDQLPADQRGPFGGGITEAVISLDVANDGKRILTTQWKAISSVAAVWRIGSDKPVLQIERPNDGVTQHGRVFEWAAFTPDGTQIIASGAWIVPRDEMGLTTGPQNVKLGVITHWDVTTGELVAEHSAHDVQGPGRIQFAPDGETFTTAGRDGVHLWRLGADRPFRHIPARGNVSSFSPDGKRLAIGAGTGVKVFDIESGEQVAGSDVVLPPVTSVAWMHDGRQIAIGGGTNIELFDIVKREARAKFSLGEVLGSFVRGASVCGIEFWFDGATIITAGNEADGDHGTAGVIRMWDINSQRLLRKTNVKTEFESAVSSLAVSPDGRLAVTVGGQGRSLALVDFADLKQLAELTDVRGFREIHAARFTPDSRFVWVADRTGQVLRWDPQLNVRQVAYMAEWRTDEERGGEELRPWMEGAVFSPDCRTLVSSHERTNQTNLPGALVFWDNERGQVKRVIRNQPTYKLVISPDGKLLAGFETDSPGRDATDTIHVWDMATGEELFTLKPQDARATAMAFSPDGKQLLTGFDRGTFAIWDVRE
jgi:WD40 repeat protein